MNAFLKKSYDGPSAQSESYSFYYFSELVGKPVYAEKISNKIGRLSDLVFKLGEHYPEAAGMFLEFGWGKPTMFIPWNRLIKIDDDGIFVHKSAEGDNYPPFVDQPGWILVESHLMGKTILDIDGRRTEVVNDVHLLESKGRLLIVHVDVSFNGFLRKWGIRRLKLSSDKLIAWKFVQPLSVEDAMATDKVSLSITKKQILELPSEDLADVLEELQGDEQQALFSALDSEKAAETLADAEPRAKRQLIANLRQERAKTILTEMTIPQISDLFSVLPYEDSQELMSLLPKDMADRVNSILSQREVKARSLMSSKYISFGGGVAVEEAINFIRSSKKEPEEISYIYIINGDGKTLVGVVDLRELVLNSDDRKLSEIMTSPVVSAEEEDLREDVEELFNKYRYHMLPVTDAQDHLLGVIHYEDLM
jgi:magnesium transporter